VRDDDDDDDDDCYIKGCAKLCIYSAGKVIFFSSARKSLFHLQVSKYKVLDYVIPKR
jgi:hypothetical protein